MSFGILKPADVFRSEAREIQRAPNTLDLRSWGGWRISEPKVNGGSLSKGKSEVTALRKFLTETPAR